MFNIICGDCLDILPGLPKFDCIFADPPDNIGLSYNNYDDNLSDPEYLRLFETWINCFINSADIIWLSFNAKWTISVGNILSQYQQFEVKPCVQTFTFGQHNNHDLGNNHRPLWRLRRLTYPRVKIYPNQVRIESERQRLGDKRANPDGRVPGDVFDFPRVTGNSLQRRKWHPTQLHEGLVEKCIRLSTPEDGTVCDPFAGTGTTLRVCKRINRECTLVDVDPYYCRQIAKEHKIKLQALEDVYHE
ncbi:hypothetical protein LCGC14_0673760 [marine sediment metagenome]|uniref:DNA methylase N-4/N-6 domain-containing protein n=1 Tax=marine sediment metagenome TaxID=412755 RepID=A0A0F9TY80_9ZZZZ